jgi:hypothetical protein
VFIERYPLVASPAAQSLSSNVAKFAAAGAAWSRDFEVRLI